MNKIFKVIYSKTRHCYVVVSELAKSHCKTAGSHTARNKTALTAAVLLALGTFSVASVFMPMTAEAADKTKTDGSNFVGVERTDGLLDDSKYDNYGGKGAQGPDSITLGLNAQAGAGTITIGDRKANASLGSVYVGQGDVANPKLDTGGWVTSIGYNSDATGYGSIALGSNAVAKNSYAKDSQGNSLVYNQTYVENGVQKVRLVAKPDIQRASVAIGYGASADNGNIAIGSYSDASTDLRTAKTTDGKEIKSYLTDTKADSYVSVGKSDALRRISNVADGAAVTDVATVGQLQELSKELGGYNNGFGIKIASDTNSKTNTISLDRNLGRDANTKDKAVLKADEDKSALVIGGRVNQGDAKGGQTTEKDYGALGQDSVTVGGADNTASGDAAVVVGGLSNTASAQYSAVVGGSVNDAIGNESSVFGGFNNDANGTHATISGGSYNRTYGEAASVFGGSMNNAVGSTSSVFGGSINTANGTWSSVIGGSQNTTLGISSTAVGGENAIVDGTNSVGIAGGSTKADNALAAGNEATVTVNNGTAIGYQATANKEGTVAFGHDKDDVYYTSTWPQKATEKDGKYYDANNKEITKDQYEALRNADTTFNDYSKNPTITENKYDTASYNRLVKVADGQEAHDVVVMEQLDKAKTELTKDLSVNAGWGINIADEKDPKTGEVTKKNVISLNRNLGNVVSLSYHGGNQRDPKVDATLSVADTGLILGGEFDASINPHWAYNNNDWNNWGATGKSSVLVGGANNLASGEASGVFGGLLNKATGQYSSVFGGDKNLASSRSSAVLGGFKNETTGDASAVLGGASNLASGPDAVVLGGESNVASKEGAVASGNEGKALGNFSIAIGRQVTALGESSMVLGGSSGVVRGQTSVGIAGGSTSKEAKHSLAAGNESVVTVSNGTALGYQATTDEANTIAFGHDIGDVSGYTVKWQQKATSKYGKYYDANGEEITKDEYNALINPDHTYNDYTKNPEIKENLYTTAGYNRLVKVADGIGDHDVVVMEQLKNALDIGSNIKIYETDENGNVKLDQKKNPIEDTSDEANKKKTAAQKASKDAWGQALGADTFTTGTDTAATNASSSDQLVTGKTLYDYDKPTGTPNYVKANNTTGQNLSALDAQVAANTSTLNDKTHNIKYYSVNDTKLTKIQGKSNEDNKGAQAMGSMAAGFNTYTDGIISTVSGAYSQIINEGNVKYMDYYDIRGTAAASYGAANVNKNTAQSGVFSGVANSTIGQVNDVTDSNAAITIGAGNTISNSYRDVNIDPVDVYLNKDNPEALRQLMKDAVKESGGQVLVMGGGNEVDSAYMSQVVGVGNTVKGNQVYTQDAKTGEWNWTTDTNKETAIKDYDSEKSSQYNYVDGFYTTLINGKSDYIIGAHNTVTGDSVDKNNSNIIFGDNHKLTNQKNNVIIGSSDTADDETKVSDAVIIGHNAKASAEGGVAIGSGSEASVAGKKTEGYDPTTGKDSTDTTATWQATNAAVSIGKADGTVTRQINGLAAGTNDTDAVNVAQLKKLEGMKANVDASNIGANLKGADGKTAPAEEITVNENAWGTALGVGIVSDSNATDAKKNGSQQLVTGGTVFNETRISAKGDNGQAKTYNYLNANNSAGKNLEALDSALKTVSTTAGAHTALTVEGNTPAGKGKDAKTNEDVYAGKNILLHESTDATTGKVTYDLKLSKDINIGKPGKDGEDGKIGIDGKDGHIGLNGSDGITVRGLDGENGAPGKDGVTITGPKGEAGKDGIDGKVGISGKDGKDAVSIFGKDGVGHIGLTGPAGTNGKDGTNAIDITVKNGYDDKDKGINGTNGVDGKDGITRIVYTDKTGEHQVATMEDGMKYAGDDAQNDATKVITKKLNNTLDIIGGADSKNLTEKNIGVNSDKDGKLNVQLAKDLTSITSISNQKTTKVDGKNVTTGAKITLGDDGSVDVNGGKITNVGSGIEKDDKGNITNASKTNAANIGDVQTIAEKTATDLTGKGLKFAANSGDVYTAKLGSTVKIQGTDKKDGHEYTADNLTTEIDKDGNITILMDKDMSVEKLAVNGKDGKDGQPGTAGSIGISGQDGKAGVGIDGKDGISIKGKDGKDGVTMKAVDGKDGTEGHIGLTGPAGTNGKDGTNAIDITVKNGYDDAAKGINGTNGVDGKDGITRIVYTDKTGEHQVATMEDGLKFKGDDDKVIAKKLNNTMEIIGGAKGDLTENNIGVNNDGGKLKVQLSKDLTGMNSTTYTTTTGEGDSATTSTTVVNGNGLTIMNGPSITNKGVDGGNKVITNVGSGIEKDANGKYTVTDQNEGNAANVGDVQNMVNDAKKELTDGTNGLNNKANIDASNIGANLKGADGKAASAEKQKTNAEKWGSAIGTGEIKADDGRMVTGKTVYDEIRPKEDGNYVKKDKTTGENLSALDSKIGKLDETKKYNYIDSGKDVSISDNLTKLDTQVKNNADAIQKNSESIQNITNNVKNLSDNAVQYDKDSNKTKVTLGGEGGTTITNVKNGVLSDSSTDAVNGKQLYNEQQAREAADKAITEKVTNNTNEITKIENGEGFTDDGKTVIKNLSKDAVQVKAGDRIKVDEATDEKTGNKTYTISANNNGTVAKGDGNLISGDTLYKEVHVDKDGSYIKSSNTVGQNLSALDTGLKTTSDLIHTNDKGDTIQIGGNSTATKIDVSGKDANGNTTGRVITGVVSDASDPNSAANVGYVNGLTAANTQQIYRDMNNAYSRLDTNINRAAAGSNALAALHPLDFDPADKASFAVGYGHYHNANAAAVGAFYQPNANTMVNMGISLGNGDPGFNAGVSFKIGKGSTYNGVSKAEMAQTIHDQAAEISTIKANDAAKDKRIDALEKENQEMKKQIQEILARLNG